MRKYIFICDKCKKEQRVKVNNLPEDWKHVKLTSSYDSYNYTEMLFCPVCLAKLGLCKERKLVISDEDTRDKLFNLFEEMVADALDNQQQ